MANTIPDILVSNTQWSNVNTLSGISTGTDLIISNKSIHICRVAISPTQPSVSNTYGELIAPYPSLFSQKLITGEVNTVWMIANQGDAIVSVQEA